MIKQSHGVVRETTSPTTSLRFKIRHPIKNWFAKTTSFTAVERYTYLYFTLLPLLWISGLLLPCAMLLVFGSFLFLLPIGSLSFITVIWFAVGIAQILSVFSNLLVSDAPSSMFLKHLASSYVLSWFTLGCAIGIGSSKQLRPKVLIACVARLCAYEIVLSGAAYVTALILPLDSLFVLSPTAHLLPDMMPARNFSFGLFIYNWEDLGGRSLPRLSLLFPWPTAMGLGGICATFISLSSNTKQVRILGVIGGLLMVVASLGRLAALLLISCLIFYIYLRCRKSIQIAGLLPLLVITACWCLDSSVGVNFTSLFSQFNAAREGASQVREEVYEANWQEFRKSPWLGHGWPGQPLADERVFELEGGMVVGSHSTVSGLLYKGGIITFSVFTCAMVLTLIQLFRRERSNIRDSSITVFLAIACTCFGEGLESLVVSNIYAFLWIGVALSYDRPSLLERD